MELLLSLLWIASSLNNNRFFLVKYKKQRKAAFYILLVCCSYSVHLFYKVVAAKVGAGNIVVMFSFLAYGLPVI